MTSVVIVRFIAPAASNTKYCDDDKNYKSPVTKADKNNSSESVPRMIARSKAGYKTLNP